VNASGFFACIVAGLDCLENGPSGALGLPEWLWVLIAILWFVQAIGFVLKGVAKL
jgi:hypothetical protein